MRNSSSNGNAHRKNMKKLEVLAIVILFSSMIFGGSLMASAMQANAAPANQPESNHSYPTTVSMRADSLGNPLTTVQLEQSSSNPVGYGAWQKANTYTATTGGVTYGTNSSEMAIELVPNSYTMDPSNDVSFHFGLNFRTAIQTGNQLYGGTNEPFLVYNNLPMHDDYEPLGIYQVTVQGILLPTDGSTSQQPTSNKLTILGAGSSELDGLYQYRPTNPADTQWLWQTTGDYQTSNSYTNWVNEVLAQQATTSSIQTFSQALGAYSLLPGAPLGAAAGAVSFLLGTVYSNAPTLSSAFAQGSTTGSDRVTFTYTYNGGGVGSLPDGDHYDAYAVAQTNNYLDLQYIGYSPWQYSPTLQITVQVLLADPWNDNYGSGQVFPAIWETLDYTFDIQLSSLFAPAFIATTPPSPVQSLTGTPDQSGNAILSWSSNYYTGDNDWISSYIISDGTNTWQLSNTMGLNPYQNNGITINQGFGVTKQYSVIAEDPSGNTSTASYVTVTTPPPPSVPPTIQFTNPSSSTTMFGPVSYTFHVSATDTAGTISSVQMYCTDVNGAGNLPTWCTATHGSGSDYYYTFNLYAGTTFEVGARATNTAGQTSYANSIDVTTLTAPTFVSTQSNINAYTGQSFTLSWQAQASSPTTYTITQNGAQVASGTWTSGTTISYTTSLGSPGTYTYTITIHDSYGNSASSSATVTVTWAPPVFTHKQPNTGDASGGQITLSWTATDPSPTTYTIYENGVKVASGNWKSGVAIPYTVTVYGTSTFTIYVYNSHGACASASCTVTVKKGVQ